VPGEGTVGTPMRAVCMDLYGPVENPAIEFCEGGVLQSFREQMRGFCYLPRQKPSSLFILSRDRVSVDGVWIHWTLIQLVSTINYKASAWTAQKTLLLLTCVTWHDMFHCCVTVCLASDSMATPLPKVPLLLRVYSAIT
jgi:hypothetical protein